MKEETKDNKLKNWYLNWISDIIEDFILLELEKSSISNHIVVPVERKYLKSVLTYVKHRCGYNAEIVNDEKGASIVPVIISWY